ncbi:MAG: hypothetical protein H7210_04565 [Pyrinomonadaceae bacterium]|nr:hypothetical protein [Phycisphaerales bacterium]
MDGLCPECGRPINARRKNIPRYTDNLVHAPTLWLASFALGATLLFISGIGMMLSLVVLSLMPGTIKAPVAGILVFTTLLWYIASLILTQPRPVMPSTIDDPRKEWRVARWSARITQFFWIGMGGFQAAYWYIYQNGIMPPTWMMAMSLVCFLIAAIGLVGLCMLLSNLAYWGDDEVGANFRTCAWMVAAAAFLASLHQFNILTNSILFGGLWSMLILVLLFVFVIVPELYLVYCLFQLQHMARWAIKNHVSADAKTRRLKAQAERNARRGVAQATSTVIREGPIALEADSSVNPAWTPVQRAPIPGSEENILPRKTGPEDPYDLDGAPR